MNPEQFQTFNLTIANHIAHVAINRPDRANALNQTAWHEMKAIFEALDDNDDVRAVVLSGEGKHFCAGIDLELLMDISQFAHQCEGRKREKLRKRVFELQAPINAIEQCSKPVIAAIHGGCIGGAVDIISACDMRYCTDDAYFCIREIDMGMVADLGTLQRLPKLIAPGIVRELAYTGRNVLGPEAERIGLANRSYPDQATLLAEVQKVAEMIAQKSPLSIRGTKAILNHTRDHSVADGLDYIATWNAAMLVSDDLMEAFQAKMQKRAGVYQ
ncbi:MAG: crotonase/enoyl-CoA hydratase family protein [Runella slithyformis]|nr:MAG: crotonase/enoyl-CoA hydratase family protein [Runella slithyformis]TAF96516.1 MAG: crotonase/enoyl-CoA hydratase family protein [Runella sp.]TAG20736.1 MAG: crotonase/enoyl-CoA hydratase family protein [Cytophagales bacterium]TAG39878.1 MAG: crotonase/enoyl-CoA hydratase family protein [Cytophagia bacterium]TAE96840.1 MAG: crotonase/enoyl-CoA hydratase family protein [Runella slithyformis]